MSKLYLGASREVITPEMGALLYGYPSKPIADAVDDDLTCTSYYFEQNGTKMLLNVSTLCCYSTNISDEIRETISKKFNIPFDNIILATTHTHSGPAMAGLYGAWGGVDYDYYQNIYMPAILKTVEDAISDKEPVTMGKAIGKSDIGINRRQLNKDNEIILGECPWGIYNPRMVILSFKTESGEIKTNLISYGAHGTSSLNTTHVTRDWAGFMTDALESHTNCMYTDLLLGAEGDVAPRKMYPDEPASLKQRDALGQYAADEVIRVFGDMGEYEDIEISVGAAVVNLPVEPRVPYDEVCKIIEEHDPEKCSFMENVAFEVYPKIKASYDEGEPEITHIPMPQTIFSFGDVVVFAGSNELFSEIGLRIDEAFPDNEVLSLVCTNGNDGYFPTEKEITLGGYEVLSFLGCNAQKYVKFADFHYIKQTINNIKDLIK